MCLAYRSLSATITYELQEAKGDFMEEQKELIGFGKRVLFNVGLRRISKEWSKLLTPKNIFSLVIRCRGAGERR